MFILYLSLAGALGVVSRYFITDFLHFGKASLSFPYPTLIINVLGSFLIGVIFAFLLKSNHIFADRIGLIIMTGFLGGFTTFSAFAIDVVKMLENSQTNYALIYILSSVILSILAAFIGVLIVR